MKIKFSNILIVLIILFFAMIQMSIPISISPLKTFPNLILTIALVFFLVGNFRLGWIWALLGGIILDLFSPFRFGWITLSFLIGVAPLYYLMNRVIRDPSYPLIFFSVFFSTIVTESLIEIFFKINLTLIPIYCAIENSIIAILAYYVIKSYIKKLEPIKI